MLALFNLRELTQWRNLVNLLFVEHVHKINRHALIQFI